MSGLRKISGPMAAPPCASAAHCLPWLAIVALPNQASLTAEAKLMPIWPAPSVAVTSRGLELGVPTVTTLDASERV